MDCPDIIDGAKVICFSLIDDRHQHARNAKQKVAEARPEPPSGLVICQYAGGNSFYLFGCDEVWNPRTDHWHHTLKEALDQAEEEYEGISKTWVYKKL